jgi:hypothetical protein
LKGKVASLTTEHQPRRSSKPGRIGELLRSIEAYKGQAVTWYSLRTAAFVFVRPGEVRHAEWSEFDLDGGDHQWRIPAAKMKMGLMLTAACDFVITTPEAKWSLPEVPIGLFPARGLEAVIIGWGARARGASPGVSIHWTG